MRALSVLAMAGRGGVRHRGRPQAGGHPGRPVLRAGVRAGPEACPGSPRRSGSTLSRCWPPCWPPCCCCVPWTGRRRGGWVAYAACLAVLGYIDLVALSIVAGHVAGVALRWHQDRDNRQLWFAAAAAAGLAACLPLAVLRLRSGRQPGSVGYQSRASTWRVSPSSAEPVLPPPRSRPALIVLDVLAWAVRLAAGRVHDRHRGPAGGRGCGWPPRAPYSLLLPPGYLLLTVGAWAVLAGIALSRLDLKIAVASLAVLAILGAGTSR